MGKEDGQPRNQIEEVLGPKVYGEILGRVEKKLAGRKTVPLANQFAAQADAILEYLSDPATKSLLTEDQRNFLSNCGIECAGAADEVESPLHTLIRQAL